MLHIFKLHHRYSICTTLIALRSYTSTELTFLSLYHWSISLSTDICMTICSMNNGYSFTWTFALCVLLKWSAAMREENETQRLLTISTFCFQLRPALLQAHSQLTLLFSQSVPIHRHFNCLSLAGLTLLPGRHSVTLNDDNRQDEDKTEGVSERRDEVRIRICQPCKRKKEG